MHWLFIITETRNYPSLCLTFPFLTLPYSFLSSLPCPFSFISSSLPFLIPLLPLPFLPLPLFPFTFIRERVVTCCRFCGEQSHCSGFLVCISLDRLIPVFLAFSVLDCFFSIKPRDCLGKCLQNDPFRVEWDVKHLLHQ